ncbi:hypothetical protein WN774_004661 [Salmonella enterica subsp. enterica serovar Bredeney]|nr:hypothetical protein [Salmonella enterica]
MLILFLLCGFARHSPNLNRIILITFRYIRVGVSCNVPYASWIGFQEKARNQNDASYLTGGTLKDWRVPDLTGNVKIGLGIAEFFKNSRTDNFAASGPMTDVVAHRDINFCTQLLANNT